MANGNTQQRVSPQQLNAIARAAIKARAVPMLQSIFSQTFTAPAGQNISGSQPVVSVIPRNVGLIRGFYIKVSATINNGSAVAINLADFGPYNLLTQLLFNDLNNNTRIQTTGWHVGLINSVKLRRPFGASFVNGTGISSGVTNTNFPVAYGDHWQQEISAPSNIAAAGNGTVILWLYLPLAYSQDDLRGAVYANVVNATMQLNLTFNPVPVVQNGTDATSAVYVGAAAGATSAAVISSATVTVYQDYLDQLPTGQGGVLLPILDLATIYELKNTTFTAIVPNQDFPMQYSNFRDFLSTTLIYVNTGATGARVGGTDINYLALQSANFTNIWKVEPALQTIQTRNHIGVDPPMGTYYISSRQRPISTVQYGNMQLIVNPITAGTGAYCAVAYEDFALVQTLNVAGSLAAS